MSDVTENLLAADTAVGPVTLLVADLDTVARYYREIVGLQDVADDDRLAPVRGAAAVSLGRGDEVVIRLVHTPGLPESLRGSAGLFHTAVLFSNRAEIAAALLRVARFAPASYVGAADHLVSEAFYLTDPEGNGIELYWDRSRTAWGWDANGHVHMATLALDPEEFIRTHLGDAASPAGGAEVGSVAARVGHVHLQVGDVAAARSFWVDAVGFEVTASVHGALFVSAGGYHHHIAVNSWNSRGAGPRASSLGLGEVTLELPGREDVAALAARLAFHGISGADDGATLTFADPWSNTVRATVAA